MANQTVTSDTNMTAVTAGLNDGQNITINSGAVVTCDSSPDKLIGQVTINDGEFLLDGANAINPIVFVGEDTEEINVNGAGILRSTLGWWEFPTTSNGTASQTFDCSTYFTTAIVDQDVFSGVWVETGRRINYDTGSGIAPKVGDWVFKVSDNDVHGRIEEVSGDGTTGYLVVTFLTGSIANNDAIEIHSIQQNEGPDYQKSWNALATAADVMETGVFTEFANVYQNSTDYLSQMGSGIAGFAFSQPYESNTLTFGNGTAGFIPPSGARIRVPMVHFCSSTTTLVTTNDTSWNATAANRYELETVNGGDCYLAGVSLGSAQFEDNLGNNFQASYCSANHGFGVYAALQRTTYDHCIFVPSINDDTRSASRSLPAVVDLVAGSDVRDCLSVAMNDTAETTNMGGQTSIGLNFERCIAIGNGPANEMEFVRVDGYTIEDLVVIGTQLIFTTSFQGTCRLLKTQRNLDGSVGNNDQVYFVSNSADDKVIGWEILQGSAPDDTKCLVIDSSRIDVFGFHFLEDKFDNEALGGSQGEEFASIGGLCSDITFARCFQDRGTPNEFIFVASGTSKNVTVLNCSGEYNGEIEPDGINTSYRGLHGGSGNLGTTTGVETDLPGTAGSNCNDIFESDTRGYLACSMCPGSTERPIEIVSGNPKFTKDGDVDVEAGDQFIIEMPYFAKGHISFRDTLPTFARATSSVADGTDLWTTVVDIEFQYDTGSGYNGTWLDLRVNANRTSITDMVSGIKLKYRITGLASRTNLQAFVIYTDTSIQAQKDNLYPIDQTPLRVVVNSEVTSSPLPGARVHIVAAAGGDLAPGTVILDRQLTDVDGEINSSYSLVSNQPYVGLVAEATTPTLHQPRPISGTITKGTGLDLSISLTGDE